jgi:hypothetical protein
LLPGRLLLQILLLWELLHACRHHLTARGAVRMWRRNHDNLLLLRGLLEHHSGARCLHDRLPRHVVPTWVACHACRLHAHHVLLLMLLLHVMVLVLLLLAASVAESCASRPARLRTWQARL